MVPRWGRQVLKLRRPKTSQAGLCLPDQDKDRRALRGPLQPRVRQAHEWFQNWYRMQKHSPAFCRSKHASRCLCLRSAQPVPTRLCGRQSKRMSPLMQWHRRCQHQLFALRLAMPASGLPAFGSCNSSFVPIDLTAHPRRRKFRRHKSAGWLYHCQLIAVVSFSAIEFE